MLSGDKRMPLFKEDPLQRPTGGVDVRISRRSSRPTYWVGPVLLAAVALASGSSFLIAIALGVISNYVTGVFGRISRRPTAMLIVQQRDGSRFTLIFRE